MNAFSRSWEITKLSFDVIKKDKELLLFPILSGVFSIIFIIAMLFPAILGPLLFGVGGNASGLIAYILIFVVYLGLSFIATFFNVCTVYTIKKRFEGGNASFLESISFAFSRIHLIFSWSLVSATVGLILRMLDNIGEKMGAIGELVMNIITRILGAAWSIITIFVVPAMVYKNIGPMDAIKSSINTLTKTWGESLIRELGTGLISLLFWIVGIVFWVILIIVVIPMGWIAVLAVATLALVYFIGVTLLFSLINAIFNTALYVYAETGKLPAFSEEIVKGAFKRRSQ